MTVNTSAIDETLLLTIDRPPVNALDLDAVAALQQAFAAARQDVPRGGVVLTERGQVFSAGVDARAFASYSGDRRQAMVRAITQMVAQLLAIPVPVVLGMIEAQAGIPFPAGPLEIIRHELSPELLRRLTLTSTVLSVRELLDSRTIDELCAVDDLRSRSLAQARSLAAQPAFRTVKRQIRGGLAQRVAALASAGQDPFLSDFG